MTKKISVTIENRSSCLVESNDVESMSFLRRNLKQDGGLCLFY